MVITTHLNGQMSIDKKTPASPTALFNLRADPTDMTDAQIAVTKQSLIADVSSGVFGLCVGYSFNDNNHHNIGASGRVTAGGIIVLHRSFYGIVWQAGRVDFAVLVDPQIKGQENDCRLSLCLPTCKLFTRASQFVGATPTSYAVVGDDIAEVFDSSLSFTSYPDFSRGVIDSANRLILASGISTGTWNMDVIPTTPRGARRSLLNRHRRSPRGYQYDEDTCVWFKNSNLGTQLKRALEQGESLTGFDTAVASYLLPEPGAYQNVGVLSFAVFPTEPVIERLGAGTTNILFDIAQLNNFDHLIAAFTLDDKSERLRRSHSIIVQNSRLDAMLQEYEGKYQELLHAQVELVKTKAAEARASGYLMIMRFGEKGLTISDFVADAMVDGMFEIAVNLHDAAANITGVGNVIEQFRLLCESSNYSILPWSLYTPAQQQRIKEAYEEMEVSFDPETFSNFDSTLVFDAAGAKDAMNETLAARSRAIDSFFKATLATLRNDSSMNTGGHFFKREISNLLPGDVSFKSSSANIEGGSVTYKTCTHDCCGDHDVRHPNIFNPFDAEINKFENLHDSIYGMGLTLDYDRGCLTHKSRAAAMRTSKFSSVKLKTLGSKTSCSMMVTAPFISGVLRPVNINSLGKIGEFILTYLFEAFGAKDITVNFAGFDRSNVLPEDYTAARVAEHMFDTSYFSGPGVPTYDEGSGRYFKAPYIGQVLDNDGNILYDRGRGDMYRPVYPMMYRVAFVLPEHSEADPAVAVSLKIDGLPSMHSDVVSQLTSTLTTGVNSLISDAQNAALKWLITALNEYGLLGEVDVVGKVTPPQGNTYLCSLSALAALTNANMAEGSDVIDLLNEIIDAKDVSGVDPTSPSATVSVLTGAGYTDERDRLIALRDKIVQFTHLAHEKVWFKGGSNPIFKETDWNLAGWYLKA